VWRTIVQSKDGFKTLYRGLDSAILRQLFYASARVGFYNYFIRLYKEAGRAPSNLDKVNMSIVSGALGAIIGNPFDVALIRRQASIT
jgi:solute carrier family 25 oxoglutarate transporter 11